MKIIATFTGILVIFLGAAYVSAHDLWLNETKSGFDIVVGHQGKHEPYEHERVKEVEGYKVNGIKVDIKIIQGKDGCSIKTLEGLAAVTAFLDNKYWMQTTDGWKNHSNREGLEVIKSGYSYKYTKHLIKWASFLAKPLGQKFEIVPLKDPTTLAPGDMLLVQIYYEGKIVSAARLSRTSDMSDTHDLETVSGNDPFMVKIGQQGLHLINAKLEVPIGSKEVIWYACSLTFNTR